MISNGLTGGDPAHTIAIWTPRSEPRLQHFTCEDLREARSYAEREFSRLDVSKVEVLEDAGGYQLRDFFELEKDWHGPALREVQKLDWRKSRPA